VSLTAVPPPRGGSRRAIRSTVVSHHPAAGRPCQEREVPRPKHAQPPTTTTLRSRCFPTCWSCSPLPTLRPTERSAQQKVRPDNQFDGRAFRQPRPMRLRARLLSGSDANPLVVGTRSQRRRWHWWV